MPVLLQGEIFFLQLGRIQNRRTGRHTLQRIILEAPAVVFRRNNAMLHAHNVRFIDLLAALTIGAAWFNIFPKQLHAALPLLTARLTELRHFPQPHGFWI